MSTYTVELSPDKETGLYLRGKQHALIAGIKPGSQSENFDIRQGDEIIQIGRTNVTTLVTSTVPTQQKNKKNKDGTENSNPSTSTSVASIVAEAISAERNRALATNETLILHFQRKERKSSLASLVSSASAATAVSILRNNSDGPTENEKEEKEHEFVPLPLRTTLSTDHFPPIILPIDIVSPDTDDRDETQSLFHRADTVTNNEKNDNGEEEDNNDKDMFNDLPLPLIEAIDEPTASSNNNNTSTNLNTLHTNGPPVLVGEDEFPVLVISYPMKEISASSSSTDNTTTIPSSIPILMVAPVPSRKTETDTTETDLPRESLSSSSSSSLSSTVSESDRPSVSSSTVPVPPVSTDTVTTLLPTKSSASTEVLKETSNLRLKIKMQQLLELFHLYDTKVEQYRQWEANGEPLSTSVLFSSNPEDDDSIRDIDTLQTLRDDTLMELNILRGQLNLEPYTPLPLSAPVTNRLPTSGSSTSSTPLRGSTSSALSVTDSIVTNDSGSFSKKGWGVHATIADKHKNDEIETVSNATNAETLMKNNDWVVIDQRYIDEPTTQVTKPMVQSSLSKPLSASTTSSIPSSPFIQRTVYPVSPPVSRPVPQSESFVLPSSSTASDAALDTSRSTLLPSSSSSTAMITGNPNTIVLKPNTIPTELLEYEASLRYLEERLRIDQDRLQRREAALGAIASRLSERQSQAAQVLATATAMAEAAKNEITLMNETRRSTIDLSDSLQTRTSPLRNKLNDDETVNRFDTEVVPGLTVHVELDTLSPRLPVPVQRNTWRERIQHNNTNNSNNGNSTDNTNNTTRPNIPSSLLPSVYGFGSPHGSVMNQLHLPTATATTSATNKPVPMDNTNRPLPVYPTAKVVPFSSSSVSSSVPSTNTTSSTNGIDRRLANYLSTPNNWSRHTLMNNHSNSYSNTTTTTNDGSSNGNNTYVTNTEQPLVMPFHQEVPERAKLWEGVAFTEKLNTTTNTTNANNISTVNTNANFNGNANSTAVLPNAIPVHPNTNTSSMMVNFHTPHTYPIPTFATNKTNNIQNISNVSVTNPNPSNVPVPNNIIPYYVPNDTNMGYSYPTTRTVNPYTTAPMNRFSYPPPPPSFPPSFDGFIIPSSSSSSSYDYSTVGTVNIPSSPNQSSQSLVVPRLSPSLTDRSFNQPSSVYSTVPTVSDRSLPNRSDYNNRFLAPATLASQQSARVVARISTNSIPNNRRTSTSFSAASSATSVPSTGLSSVSSSSSSSAPFVETVAAVLPNVPPSITSNTMNLRSANVPPVGNTKGHQDKPSRPRPKMEEGIFPGE